MTDNIFIQYVNMPTTIKSTVTHNEDGSYTIFLNARIAQNQQADAYLHELQHILRLDFENRHDKAADRLEYYTHQFIG